MAKAQPTVHVSRVRRKAVLRDGTEKTYRTDLLRHCYREGGKVKTVTVANLTSLPEEVVDEIDAMLKAHRAAKGQTPARAGILVELGQVTVDRQLRHGDVAAIWAVACKLGLPKMLGPACPERDAVMALVVARLARPASKASTLRWLEDTTLGADLGLEGLDTDGAYAAMDWLAGRQPSLERALAAKHLSDPAANPSRMALADLTSVWMEGVSCPLAQFGYSRDKKRGKTQIEFALVTNPEGVPVALRVFEGNTNDSDACVEVIEALAAEFHMDQAVLVGDRGMVTGTRIADLRERGKMGWIGALTHAQIRALAGDQRPLQMSLFDERDDLAVITDDAFPGERLVACHNPLTAKRAAAKRERLIQATLADLDKVRARVHKGTLRKAADIGEAVGKVIGKHKAAKFIATQIGDRKLVYQRDVLAVQAEEAADGVYVIRTSLEAEQMPAADVVRSYKRLSRVEQDFAIIKGDDVQVRPVWHRRADRVTAHLLICMLASYLAWHLRQAWAELTFTDTCPDPEPDPVKPRTRSEQAQSKASTGLDADGNPVRSFRDMLDHLASMSRDTITLRPGVTTDILPAPTRTQARAFELIGAPIPAKLR